MRMNITLGELAHGPASADITSLLTSITVPPPPPPLSTVAPKNSNHLVDGDATSYCPHDIPYMIDV